MCVSLVGGNSRARRVTGSGPHPFAPLLRPLSQDAVDVGQDYTGNPVHAWLWAEPKFSEFVTKYNAVKSSGALEPMRPLTSTLEVRLPQQQQEQQQQQQQQQLAFMQ